MSDFSGGRTDLHPEQDSTDYADSEKRCLKKVFVLEHVMTSSLVYNAGARSDE
jgi:hypothetical protein